MNPHPSRTTPGQADGGLLMPGVKTPRPGNQGAPRTPDPAGQAATPTPGRQCEVARPGKGARGSGEHSPSPPGAHRAQRHSSQAQGHTVPHRQTQIHAGTGDSRGTGTTCPTHTPHQWHTNRAGVQGSCSPAHRQGKQAGEPQSSQGAKQATHKTQHTEQGCDSTQASDQSAIKQPQDGEHIH